MVVNETPSTPQHQLHGHHHQQPRNGNERANEARNIASPQTHEQQDQFGLQNLTTEELVRLDTDEDVREEFIEKLPFVQHQNEELEQLMNRIESLALDNVARREALEERKRKLEALALEFKQLGQHWDTTSQRYQRKAEDFSPQHIKELLQIAVSTADAKSDDEAQRFLCGDSDVATFLQNFIETRKLYTMRKAKEERLVQQLNALERAAF